MNGRVKAAVAIFILLTLTSCVTSSPYKTDAAHPIRAISISHNVPMPAKMTFYGLSEQMAGLFGGVVGVLSTIFRTGENFDLPTILPNELSAELAKTGKFKILPQASDAEVRIRVREYGFMQAGFMQRKVKPLLTIETQMVRKDGTVVWQSGVVINQKTKGTPTVMPEDLKNNPQAARAALHTAARVWASKMAASLK